MKYLPFRQIVFSILLPVLLYVWGVPACEKYFTRYHYDAIESILLQTDHSLLEGEVSVRQVVRDNISRYTKTHGTLSLFSVCSIRVLSSSGDVVYPVSDALLSLLDDQQKVASENFRLLENGLTLKVVVYSGPDAPLSAGALFFFSMLALGGLYVVYKKQVRHAFEERRKREETITLLMDGEKSAEKELEALNEKQEGLQRNLEKARVALSESNEIQGDLIEEIEVLEALLEENEARLVCQAEESRALAQSIEAQPPIQEARSGKKKVREREAAVKRLKTLYKELRMHDRAIKGFMALDEGMRLKCEELIQQLNGEPDRVTIKRKVFGGKGMATFFESEFAYKGRLYFMRHPGGTVEVVAIGTKNSQATELGFLNRISSGMKSA